MAKSVKKQLTKSTYTFVKKPKLKQGSTPTTPKTKKK
jgi:hypothetical protein